MNGSLLAKIMSPEDREKLYQNMYDNMIEWHCEGRHGVIRNIVKGQESLVYDMLVKRFGPKCGWRSPNSDGTSNVEFIYNVFGKQRGNRPWNYCGTTVLFEDWLDREINRANLALSFGIGDKVSFLDKNNVRHTGIVSGVRKNVTVIVGNLKWRVSPNLLRKEE